MNLDGLTLVTSKARWAWKRSALRPNRYGIEERLDYFARPCKRCQASFEMPVVLPITARQRYSQLRVHAAESGRPVAVELAVDPAADRAFKNLLRFSTCKAHAGDKR